jgi:hypothetical protein
MARKVTVQVELPGDLKQFRLPPALNKRLHALLDKQDMEGKLTVAERREAEALVELTEMLTLLKLRARFNGGSAHS